MDDTPREPLPGETPAFGPDDDPWAEPLPPPVEEAGRSSLGSWHEAFSSNGEMRCLGPCPICRAADLFRAGAPAELQEQWQSLQRELLLAVRALIEHHLQNLDGERKGSAPRRPPPAAGVEDIPID